MNKKKRTLKGLLKEKFDSGYLSWVWVTVAIVILICLTAEQDKGTPRNQDYLGRTTILPLNDENSEDNLDILTHGDSTTPESTTSSTDLDASSSAENSDVAEPLLNSENIPTENYRYFSISNIPEQIPMDCAIMDFKVDLPNNLKRGQIVKTFDIPYVKAHLTLAVPDLPNLSNFCDQYGYQIISILSEKAETGEVVGQYFAYNPEEEPFITIFIAFSTPSRIDIFMDAQIFEISLFSSSEPKNGFYQSLGVSESNYSYWGGSSNGNNNYLFNATDINKVVKSDDWCNPLEWAAESIEEYREYWHENRDAVMRLRECFNDDRSEFDLITCLKGTGVNIRYIDEYHIILCRYDGVELMIEKVFTSPDQTYAKLYIEDSELDYVPCYSPRINGVPMNIMLPNDIELTSGQLNTILYFCQVV